MKTNTYNNKAYLFLISSFLMAMITFQHVNASGLHVKLKSGAFEEHFDISEENISDDYSFQLEDWMLNLNRWEMPVEMSVDIDHQQDIELWMTDMKHWTGGFISVTTINTKENSLEPWMINPCHWNNGSRKICSFKNNCNQSDEDMAIHEWMKNTYFFKI
jgi:hypothetical protein